MMIILLLFQFNLFAEDIDKVLDTLEKRVLQKQSSSFKTGTAAEGSQTESEITFPASQVEATPLHMQKLKNIKVSLNRLQHDLDRIDQEILVYQKSIEDQQDQLSRVEVNIEGKKFDLKRIQKISLGINGWKVYEERNPKQTKLFSGSLSKGDHTLKLEISYITDTKAKAATQIGQMRTVEKDIRVSSFEDQHQFNIVVEEDQDQLKMSSK